MSDAVREAVADVSTRLQKAAHFTPLRASWVPPANYHVTLFFLGNVPDAQAAKLAAQMPAAAAGVRSFLLDVRHVGTFPEPKKGPPRVLWLNVYKPAAELEAVRQRAAQVIRRAGLAVPEQDFSPHVTIARFKSTKGVFAFTKLLQQYQFFKAGRSPVTRLVLMESLTGGGEARYVPFASAPLDPAPEPPPSPAAEEETPDA